MKRRLCFWGVLMAITLTVGAQKGVFNRYFTGGTLRVDMVRSGNSHADTLNVVRFVDRDAAWHGSRTNLIDTLNAGQYRVIMTDKRSGNIIWQHTYSSLFAEYAHTEVAKSRAEWFEEVLLMPMPKREVVLTFQRRDAKLVFIDDLVVPFNPRTSSIENRIPLGSVRLLEQHGDPAVKVDVAIVAQGYDTVSEEQLSIDFYRMREMLFSYEPFASRRSDFNLYGVKGNVGAKDGVLGADRYVMTKDVFRLHDVLADAPCDYVVIMVNSSKYGGGAVYNFYATTTLHDMADLVLTHELGHAIGDLADEYVDEDLSYSDIHLRDVEPVEPNISNLKDFGSKWQSMLPKGTSVPSSMPQPDDRRACGPLGVYEGAGYAQHGVYRPTPHCMMRDYAPFCPVCRQRMDSMLDKYVK
ncbi:MAG: hypothetical protein IJ761_03545 [Bacteroidales bacterium]|nr:hypothetical protein [Bacteroidales bacterium]